jgi:hypothetical protein
VGGGVKWRGKEKKEEAFVFDIEYVFYNVGRYGIFYVIE